MLYWNSISSNLAVRSGCDLHTSLAIYYERDMSVIELRSVDPGATKPHAWADWEGGKLSGLGYGRRSYAAVDTLVMESQQVYSRNGAKGADALIELAQCAGIYVGGLCAANTVKWVLPRIWKKQMTEDAVKASVMRSLSTAEIDLFIQRADEILYWTRKRTATSDLYHAVGLGLWYLGRWTVPR